MRIERAILCGWPGLWGLWRHGQLSALVLAVGFAALLNGAVVATFVFPELTSASFQTLLWITVGLVWFAAAAWTHRQMNGSGTSAGAEDDQGLFLQAQAEYLKGHWFEAETLLEEQLEKYPDDADARLLLVGVLRRSQRYEEAGRQLHRLRRCPGAEKWELETERERALLESSLVSRRGSERGGSEHGPPGATGESRDPSENGDARARAA